MVRTERELMENTLHTNIQIYTILHRSSNKEIYAIIHAYLQNNTDIYTKTNYKSTQ